MEHLKSVFKKNGYPCDTVNRALHHQRNKRRSKEEQTQRTEVTTTIPYVKAVSERIRRICAKHNIKVIFHSGRTLRSILSHVKPQPDLLNHPGVIYRISCLDCDRSYIGETEHYELDYLNIRGVARTLKLRSQQLHNTAWRNTIELTGKAALS